MKVEGSDLSLKVRYLKLSTHLEIEINLLWSNLTRSRNLQIQNVYLVD